MASDLPSSPSSHASDASSPASLSSSPIEKNVDVASVDEVRRTIKYADPAVELKFCLVPDASLAEAHEFWKLLTAGNGGHGELTNPEVLSNKEEALEFVGTRLERLRRWKNHVDRKHVRVLSVVSNLEKVIHGGGPGVPAGYEAHQDGGEPAVIDADQVIAKKQLGNHIATIRALFLQGSPGSPATDDDLNVRWEREVKEQLDIARLNLDYLQIKARGLKQLSDHIVEGIEVLEKDFVYQRTHLGAGDANFVRFIDVGMYPHEADC